jgi:hypothetical protein
MTDTENDPFIQHTALILLQESGVTVSQARFLAWTEGPEGYAKRLEIEDMLEELEYWEE